MAKKRLVFTLLYQNGAFCLSRNFRLQRVGNLSWLDNNYRFSDIATAIDELVILDVTRGQRDLEAFCDAAGRVSANCFMPLALGGGITSLQDAETMINNGADKLVVNTLLAHDPDLVCELVRVYGSQCIIASVDYRLEAGRYVVYVDRGQARLELELCDYLSELMQLQVGELYLNSIDRDGTSQGYLLEVLDQIPEACQLPLTLAGGAGNQNHLLAGLRQSQVDAAATANLFNFVGDGLPKARQYLHDHDLSMAKW
ncbi:MAG: imidazole glycerol phosphate synthase subunit HisF [Cyanobacteria bacterium K_Offshore_0m_m2_072]|nr:imidazole glycerol phosphate synthase subunit HisF [Cyanobacteria bacterium K_Offshore_0m_m2_072]